ncbi:hypothetical protein E2C01_030580 [Portunus trituberculatus]|uniref:Uncharacterized protein n=1 Tax=Portunus trituberculatus TaxID=210409 RepID=A0A5B7EV77_PORTR|nr:hypothetical protein [Portunus trituberculatus]
MLGNQAHVPCVGGWCVPLDSHAWRPSPSSQWCEPYGPWRILLRLADAAVPGDSGVGQGLSAPMPVGHPLSTDKSYEMMRKVFPLFCTS